MSRSFAPIAIVGQSCLVPGALDPTQLWENILAGHDLLSAPPPDHWRLSPASMLSNGRVASDRGGYVGGFQFDPFGFALPPEALLPLDPLFHWVLSGVRSALRDAHHDLDQPAHRAGLVLGNLGYPSASLTRYAEAVWFGEKRPDSRNRFHLGLPPDLTARALRLGLGGFSIDAACASSLYAIKLACDRLHDGQADLMVAGGVNRADDLFLHAGFTALNALSASGQSRPFHRQANGLVPAEGAAFIVLKRLADALASGDHILGVIRGIGLSNDGRSAGLLVPSEAGQIRAIQSAYAMSGLRPEEISLVECHATGTPIGDAVEIRSMQTVFAQNRGLAIGSLKSNLGHLITASGAAGVLKLLGAIRTGLLPPMRNADDPLELLRTSQFRLLEKPEPWNCSGPRRAAISAFGFGGNNAHLILEQWSSGSAHCGSVREQPAESFSTPEPSAVPESLAPSEFGVVGIGVVAADGQDAGDFVRTIFNGESRVRDLGGGRRGAAAEEIKLALNETRFPPRDLERTLGQQLLILKAAQEALGQAGALVGARTGVFVGMECDPQIGRHGARWRLAELLRRKGIQPTPEWLTAAQDSICPLLDGAAGVVGAMPNMPANRLNSQFDLSALGFTVSAGVFSGTIALELAIRALRTGEIDTALVGAVDLSCELVHEQATGPHLPGDAAVLLVLRRLADLSAPGPAAVLELNCQKIEFARRQFDNPSGTDLTPLLGRAHAASGLVHIAAAAFCCRHRLQLNGLPATPWLPSQQSRSATFPLSASGIIAGTLSLHADSRVPALGYLRQPAPRLYRYFGPNRAAVFDSLRQRKESLLGLARLVIVAANASELEERSRLAEQLLTATMLPADGTLAEGIYFFETPVRGELGFVFTGAAAAYRGMGRELLTALPVLTERLAARFKRLEEVAGWIFEVAQTGAPTPQEQLQGCSFLCQIHAELTMGLLGIKPAAVLGLSSGETNSLFATGAWQNIDGLFEEIPRSGMYERELGGQFEVASRSWNLAAGEPVAWSNLRVSAPVEAVRAALLEEPRAHLLIIHAPDDCLIGGQAEACKRVLERLGAPPSHPAGHDLIVHCPEMAQFADVWRAIHHRPTTAPAGIRFYSNATADTYIPEDGLVAELLLAQASATVDFPRTIHKAWADGVRIFVEHGPRNLCSDWISKTLGDRPHLTVALDRGSSLRTTINGIAKLLAAGVPMEMEPTLQHLEQAHRLQADDAQRYLSFPAHPAPVILPPLPSNPMPASQRMIPAPVLPPILPTRAPKLTALTERIESTEQDAVPAIEQIRALSRGLAEAGQNAMAGHVSVLRKTLEARLAMFHHVAPGIGPHMPAPIQSRSTTAPIRPLAASVFPAPATHSGPPPSLRIPEPPEPPEPAEPPEPGVTAREQCPAPCGLTLSREQLVIHAEGEISRIFGPAFRGQDGYRRQVRMPMPPLLLADRVTGIKGEPGVLGVGSVWTETDVRADSWFVHQGRMPAGIMIESGQADLLLVSWQGIDSLNRDERVYRLLGCELTYHGGLPEVGDTLCYDIHIDSHAAQGNVRLFFFHYECRINGIPRLTVRNGQAGFFTDAELANSAGVIWDPRTAEHRTDGPLDAPRVKSRSAFTREQVQAFAAGRVWECFGPGYELSATHSWSPRIPSGRLLLIEEVTHLDPTGGPWGRGYMRVVNRIGADDWFFSGHFKNDPCMPGTLMAEGCQQAMAFYLTALGFTLEKDGWRFEPIPEQNYHLRCRGQVTPSSRELVYEVFVEELVAGPIPMIYADLLGTIDGVKAIHGRRMGVQLVPHWPMEGHLAPPPAALIDSRPSAEKNGFRYDKASILACAWGRPSNAFGPMYQRFDGPSRVARLPCPPYHFISRVVSLSGEPGVMKSGAEAVMEYEIPSDAWYFSENGAAVMPLCVLMEAALQPCGWLASYIGAANTSSEDLYFRNLDGVGTIHAEIPRPLAPSGASQQSAHSEPPEPPEPPELLVTRAKLISLSQTAGMILVSFEVECSVGGKLVFEMRTGFGFFPKAALASQLGLAATVEERQQLEAPSDFDVDLSRRPARYFSDLGARLPEAKLLMLDRITGYWPTAGAAGLGRLRAHKDVNPSEWFFKAHFFQDPVQPGSLGLEAMSELLQFYMLHEGLDEGIANPHFEPLALGKALTWKYRGQVVPQSQRVTVELEIQEVGRDARGAFAVAEAFLWVDGKKIYHGRNLCARISSSARTLERTFTIDPARDLWLGDHCPNYIRPVLPMMDIVNRLAEAAAAASPRGGRIIGLQNVQLNEWVAFEGARQFQTSVEPCAGGYAVQLKVAKPQAEELGAPSYVRAAAGLVILGEEYPTQPEALPLLKNAQPAENPYQSGALFHGPAFQLLRELEDGEQGASALLDAAGGSVPLGLLHPALLDAAFHAIPNDELQRWFPLVSSDQLGFPRQLSSLELFGPTPTAGQVRCEVRCDSGSIPAFLIQLSVGTMIWAQMRVVHLVVPKGRIGLAPRDQRRIFLRDQLYVPGLSLSESDAQTTRLSLAEIRKTDWWPGSVHQLYRTASPLNVPAQIAIKEHLAKKLEVHPATVEVGSDLSSAGHRLHPLNLWPVEVAADAGSVAVRDLGSEQLDLSKIRAYWQTNSPSARQTQLEEFFFRLCQQFVRRVSISDPEAMEKLRGLPVLFLGNHQVLLESCVFSVLAPVLVGSPIIAMAKIEQKNSLLVQSVLAAFGARTVSHDRPIIYFDQKDPGAMLSITADLKSAMLERGRSALVHVEGVRSLSCRLPIKTVSGVLLDLAAAAGVPIIPVRFTGGLPVQTAAAKLDFPLGFGKQDYLIGRPIYPSDLAGLTLLEKKEQVIGAINSLGPLNSAEEPAPPNLEFAERIRARVAHAGVSEVEAVLLECASLPLQARIADFL